MGRPSTYTPELASKVLERLSAGEYLSDICAEEGMPGKGTLFRWKEQHEDFRNSYARARELQAIAVAERAVNVARTAKDPALGRLAYDAEKWMASKLDPKNYGDKVAVDHSGQLDTKGMSLDELNARIAAVSAQLSALGVEGSGVTRGTEEQD